jgi:hypothetical protein
MFTKTAYYTIISISLLVLCVFCFSKPCLANPINPDARYITEALHPLLFFLSPLVESLAVLAILAWMFKLNLAKSWTRLFLLVFIVNFITLLPTQYLASYLLDNFNLAAMYSVEILVIIVEWLFLALIFSTLFRHKDISRPVSIKQVLLITIVVNALSFALGLAFFRYFPSYLIPIQYYMGG